MYLTVLPFLAVLGFGKRPKKKKNQGMLEDVLACYRVTLCKSWQGSPKHFYFE
jgi:hypothetical protein